MAYKIYAFDGLVLPEYMQDRDQNAIGTGVGVSPLVRLPGGGWYDTRGELPALAGLSPVTRSCALWGETAALLRAAWEELRAKKLTRGKLTVLFDDGELRWQYARLLEVETPRPMEAVGKFLPVELSFQPLSQFWYGDSYSEWTWGDLSWTFGDGSAVFGDGGDSFAIVGATVTQSVVDGGNIECKDVVWTLAPSTDEYTAVTLRNLTNGSYMVYSGTIDSDIDRLIIDCGAKSCRSVSSTTVAISAIVSEGERIYITTGASHGLAVGDFIEVAGTTNYDGEYEVATVPGATTMRVYAPNPRSGASEATGTVAEVTGQVANLSVGNERDWFTLDPGTNSVRVSTTGSTIADGVWTLEHTDHYA